MTHPGLLILLFMATLLVEQTGAQASRLKAKKDHRSKDREKDGDLKTQIDKLWREVNSLKEMQALQTVCLRGTKLHKKCYLAFDGSKPFHEANEDCITKGGTLAVPRDNDENQALRDYGKRSLPGAAEFWLDPLCSSHASLNSVIVFLSTTSHGSAFQASTTLSVKYGTCAKTAPVHGIRVKIYSCARIQQPD
uniref:C-type lectin domain family 3 member A isoform X2 n=1 Tax=Geotrypetes seraphini TaxID=260995 RepID=A0A6P8QLY0_GEOSA|nr:C-type lectin domain family 3 member A isoform X2 [Geotrypetes seraphini]